MRRSFDLLILISLVSDEPPLSQLGATMLELISLLKRSLICDGEPAVRTNHIKYLRESSSWSAELRVRVPANETISNMSPEHVRDIVNQVIKTNKSNHYKNPSVSLNK